MDSWSSIFASRERQRFDERWTDLGEFAGNRVGVVHSHVFSSRLASILASLMLRRLVTGSFLAHARRELLLPFFLAVFFNKRVVT